MKRIISLILAAVLCVLAMTACGSQPKTEPQAQVQEQSQEQEQPQAQEQEQPEEPEQPEEEEQPQEPEQPEEEEQPQEQDDVFTYEHDPRENPEAMADIIENPDAVYGFSPDPESKRLGSYAGYDWTDPEFVAQAQEERRAYHESMDSMTDILYQMREDGASIEEMARAVSEERNRIRIASYHDDPEGLASLKESNLKTYGREEGPTPDDLFEKYGSWTMVMQRAFSSNMGMDACCGLYDEYYWLYMELGYVE